MLRNVENKGFEKSTLHKAAQKAPQKEFWLPQRAPQQVSTKGCAKGFTIGCAKGFATVVLEFGWNRINN